LDVVEGYDDEGGASRFFYCPKAPKAERQECDHPTVKPIRLCQYLATLILPPARESPRKLLVPYSGSGSEIIGALQAGWDSVTGIEINASYVAQAKRRLRRCSAAA
jgi:site-specific DNA-methyltransferase (adenine-specific)